MPRFELKQSTRHITAYAGLVLIGQCLAAAGLLRLDKLFPVPKGQIRTADIVKSYVGLLALGKRDVEAIEGLRQDRFFRAALDIQKVPSSAWLRQRLEQLAVDLREATDAFSVPLRRNAKVPVTAHGGYVCLDVDTLAMDNRGTKKACVSRTYQGVDGYTPMAAYLGNEGWCLALELRPGRPHSALETHDVRERVLPRARELAPVAAPVLSRSDSGFDSVRLLFQQDDEKRAGAEAGRRFEYLVKGNPRQQVMADGVDRANEAWAWREERPGQRVARRDVTVERSWQKPKRHCRLVVRLIERTIDKQGQSLWFPDYPLEGWWTSLDEKPETVIELYCEHATHEPCHSEIKSDLDLERLPSGQFDGNDLILPLAMRAYNGLRLIGPLGRLGAFSPVRHPAKRRRIKTVLQDIRYRAAPFIRKARRRVLNFGRQCPAFRAFVDVQEYVLEAGPSP